MSTGCGGALAYSAVLARWWKAHAERASSPAVALCSLSTLSTELAGLQALGCAEQLHAGLRRMGTGETATRS